MKQFVLVLLLAVVTFTAFHSSTAGGAPQYQPNRYQTCTAENQSVLRTEFKLKNQLARLLLEMGYTPDVLRRVSDFLSEKSGTVVAKADRRNIAKAIANRSYRSEQIKTLLSDVIVKARVTAVTPKRIGEFHSVAWLSVEHWYRDDLHLDHQAPLSVLMRSGEEDGYKTVTSDVDELELGETVWVFLSANSLYLDAERNAPTTFAQLQTESQLYFQVEGLFGGVYRSRNQQILSSHDGNTVSLSEWEGGVSEMLQLLGR